MEKHVLVFNREEGYYNQDDPYDPDETGPEYHLMVCEKEQDDEQIKNRLLGKATKSANYKIKQEVIAKENKKAALKAAKLKYEKLRKEVEGI